MIKVLRSSKQGTLDKDVNLQSQKQIESDNSKSRKSQEPSRGRPSILSYASGYQSAYNSAYNSVYYSNKNPTRHESGSVRGYLELESQKSIKRDNSTDLSTFGRILEQFNKQNRRMHANRRPKVVPKKKPAHVHDHKCLILSPVKLKPDIEANKANCST